MDEEEIPKLGWDHQTFLFEGKPFYPDLTDNTTLIRLPCEPHSDLNWKIPCVGDKRILWEFDLGLAHPFFPIDDELRFKALVLALKHFSQTIWPKYKDQTLGAILYRGSAEFSLNFLWTEQQRENKRAWVLERGGVSNDLLFSADAFAAYFQLLAHSLPDELPLLLCFDERFLSSIARALNLLTKERFEHFLIAVRSKNWPMPGLRWDEETLYFHPIQASFGICLPEAASMTEELLNQIDETIRRYDEMNLAYRVIPEAFLAEQWEGVDEICIFPEAMSPQGARKLRGFVAAGGVVEENRGRGIRTPGLLVPNQSR